MPYKDPVIRKQKKKEYYQKNKARLSVFTEEQRVVIRERDNKRRWRKKQAAVALFGNKCFDCGGTFQLPCYDFHHVDPLTKDFDPCSKLGKAEFFEEIKKCILLCANCHRVRHFTDETTK